MKLTNNGTFENKEHGKVPLEPKYRGMVFGYTESLHQ
jgi:hypothetical protein